MYHADWPSPSLTPPQPTHTDWQVFEQYGSLKPTLGAGFNINGGAVMLCNLGTSPNACSIAGGARQPPDDRGRPGSSSPSDGPRRPIAGLEEDLKAIGNPMKRVLARTVTGDPLFDVNIPSILPDSLKFNGDPAAYTVMRSDLQAALEAKLPEGKSIDLKCMFVENMRVFTCNSTAS